MILWVLHFASVAFMTGLVWLIQMVHYPLMRLVEPSRFAEFHLEHSSRITWIVGPVMVLELLSAALLVMNRPQGLSPAVVWLSLGLSLWVFLATGLLSVPAHAQLSQGFADAPHRFLVLTNWLRTLAWSLHLGLAVFATARLLTR
jgi:hypothetical protein